MPVTAISFSVRTLVTFGSGWLLIAASSRRRLKTAILWSVAGASATTGTVGVFFTDVPLDSRVIDQPGFANGSRVCPLTSFDCPAIRTEPATAAPIDKNLLRFAVLIIAFSLLVRR